MKQSEKDNHKVYKEDNKKRHQVRLSKVLIYVLLSWEWPVGAELCRVYYGKLPGDFTKIISTTKDNVKLSVEDKTPTYFFVRCRNKYGVSPWSREVCWKKGGC